MSLCRFSSNNFGCDLYCYYDCDGGITTHVARNRVLGDIPKVPSLATVSNEEWLAAHQAQMSFIDTAERAHIGLPEDGESFNNPDLESFKSRLTYLRELGYVFPDYLFDADEEPEPIR